MDPTSWTEELISLAILTSVKTRNKWTVLTLSCYFYWHFLLFYFGFSSPLISAKSNISCLTGSYIWIHIRNRNENKQFQALAVNQGLGEQLGYLLLLKALPSDVGISKDNVLRIPGNIENYIM